MLLYNAINRFRASSGLAAIPLSRTMTAVAKAHAEDVLYKPPYWVEPSDCEALHSWWDGPLKCCYRADNPTTYPCMWDKPKQVGGYSGSGFEIVNTGRGAADQAAADNSVRRWAGSPPHAAVVLNRYPWTGEWKALGCSIASDSGYFVASCWFGVTLEP